MEPHEEAQVGIELKMEINSVFRRCSVQDTKHWTQLRNPATLTAICHCHSPQMLIYVLQNLLISTFI